MVATAELVADRWKGSFRMFTAQVHRNLTRQGDVLRTSFCLQVTDLDIEIFTSRFLNIFHGDLALSAFQRIAQDVFGKIDGNRRLGQR